MNSGTSQTSSSTSPSLLRRASDRDPEAWSRLAKLYSPLVYRWARQGGLQSNDAADVVQDVFGSVAGKIDHFRMDEPDSSFRGWLWTITRNEVRLHYRKQGNRPDAAGGTEANNLLQQQPELLDQAEEPSGFDSRKSLMHRALQLVRQDFNEQTWRAFWRLAVDGQSASEIAEDLGMNPAAVRQAKYRVLCRLREELESC